MQPANLQAANSRQQHIKHSPVKKPYPIGQFPQLLFCSPYCVSPYIPQNLTLGNLMPIMLAEKLPDTLNRRIGTIGPALRAIFPILDIPSTTPAFQAVWRIQHLSRMCSQGGPVRDLAGAADELVVDVVVWGIDWIYGAQLWTIPGRRGLITAPNT